MAAPLYFLARVNAAALFPRGELSRSLLASRGLGDVWADVQGRADLAYCEIIGRGPDDGPGIVVTALPVQSREPPRRIGYYPDNPAFQWTRLDDGLWIGIDQHYPPTPADLARRQVYEGYRVELADGNGWEIPVLRRVETGEPSAALPRDMFWGTDGAFRLELRRQHAELWRTVDRVASLFFRPGSGEWGEIELEQALAIALTALGLNYRLGPREQYVLRLVNTSNWQDVLGAMVDAPKFLAWIQADAEKKSAQKANAPSLCPPASASTSPGVPDGSPATSRPGPTSSLHSCCEVTP